MKSGKKLGFIGAGNMAGALIQGVLARKLYRAGDIWVSDAVAAQRRLARRRHGVSAAKDNVDLVRGSQLVVLAVKPQTLPQVLEEVRAAANSRHLFVSIAAGVPLRRIEQGLGGGAVRVVRVMPNTPALLGRGMSVLVRGSAASARDLRRAMRIFRAVGDAMAFEDEGLLDAVTGLSGSGPAYVYRLAEALIEGGVRQGLAAGVASRLVFQTFDGASAMLRETDQTPQQLREMVSSPGGTTLAGLAELERAGFFAAAVAAVAAATARSRELGGGADGER
ncbi:MAG: pyrroline-5-carboxylate reductase [Deltaproteobacteria bacterium]|nr:pyrroline-5-carboxylate reductase [Deltaproteobacteria bacterium]